MMLPLILGAALAVAQQATPTPPALPLDTFHAYIYALPEAIEMHIEQGLGTPGAHVQARRYIERVRKTEDERDREKDLVIRQAERAAHKALEKVGATRQWMSSANFAPGLNRAFLDFGGPEPRLSLEIDNLPIRDAIQKVFKTTNFEFSFDDTVARDIRVTLKAPNVRLSTALDIITDAGNVNWTREMRINSEDATPKIHYRILKAKPLNRMAFVKPTEPGAPPKIVHIGPGAKLLSSGTSVQSLVNIVMPEERLTVKCPHCKEKVVTFRPSSDKTRKGVSTTAPKKWRFCPLCGKPVDFHE